MGSTLSRPAPALFLDQPTQNPSFSPKQERGEPQHKRPRAECAPVKAPDPYPPWNHSCEAQDPSRQPPISHRLSNLTFSNLIRLSNLDILAAIIATLILLSSGPRGPPPHLNRPIALPLIIQHLAENIQHPTLPLYLAALTTYTAIALYNVLHPPRYWPECGLVAIVVAVLVGAWYGTLAMADTVVVGGLVSLVVARGVEWWGLGLVYGRERGVGVGDEKV